MSKKNKKKRTAGDVIRTIIMFAALAVFLFSCLLYTSDAADEL